MTFIKSHAEALAKYRPIYVGAHTVDGIPLPQARTYVLNTHTPLGVFREVLFRRWQWTPSSLVKKLKSHDPRVVHAHFGTSGPAGMALAERLEIPLVITFHGQDATMNRDEMKKSHRGRELLGKKDRLIERAGAFIAVSRFVKDRLIEVGYPENKVVLHRNGVDLDFFRPADGVERSPIILFIGRFVEKKGARYLIDAATKLRAKGVPFELVMIGSGPCESELKSIVAKADIPCTFTGFLTVQEVKQWLGRSRVLAVPSVTAVDGDSEGLPTVLLEAQAMEMAVVATRHSGIPEGVKEGVTAELVEERDSKALAECLRSFLVSSAKARAFGQAGRRFVSRHFDLSTQVRGLEEIYSDLYDRWQKHRQTLT
jgi:glycosyltransferase involved in cell wall biosynthesis